MVDLGAKVDVNAIRIETDLCLGRMGKRRNGDRERLNGRQQDVEREESRSTSLWQERVS